MKICPNCNAEVEDHFELCWNCNYSFEVCCVAKIKDERESDLKCLRCGTPLFFYGNYDFREGAFVGALKPFDLFACPACGKMEFHLPSDEWRRLRDDVSTV